LNVADAGVGRKSYFEDGKYRVDVGIDVMIGAEYDLQKVVYEMVVIKGILSVVDGIIDHYFHYSAMAHSPVQMLNP
jgi:hypothetical protein